MSTSRSRTAPSRAATSRRRLRWRRVRSGAVAVPEDAPRRPHPPRRDPHPVEFLGIRTLASARFAGDHPGEVEAEHLAAGLGDVVAGQDARRLPDDETLAMARGLRGRAGSGGRPRRCLPARASRACRRFGRRPGGARRSRPGRRRRGCIAGRGISLGGCRGGLGRTVVAGGRFPLENRFRHAVRGGPALVGRCRRQGGLELRAGRRDEAGVGLEDRAQLDEPRLVPGRELGLELGEAMDDPAACDDVDLVEAQLGGRVDRLEASLAAELADRDELDEWRVAAQLEDQRPGAGRRPVVGLGRPVGRALELLPAGQRAVRRGGRLHRDDRAAAGLPQPRGVAGPGERAVRRVEVAVLVLGGPGRRHGTERARAPRRRGTARRPRGRAAGT